MGSIISLCASFAVAVLVMPVIIRIARRKGWFDRVDGRKIHTGNVPRLGGVGIYLALVVGIAMGLVASPDGMLIIRQHMLDLLLLFVGLSAMFAVGLIDDFTNIPAMRKLVGQLVAAATISVSGFRIDVVALPFTGTDISLGLLSFPVTIIWIVAIANAINLIDGMDGFAGGVGLIASGAFAAIGAIQGDGAVVLVAIAAFGASAAFLLYNRPPAHIFMGDSGSLLLGTFLAVMPLLRGADAVHAPALNVFVAATILLIPVLDTITAIIRRARRHQPIHQADNEHLHHKLLNLLGSTRNALYLLYAYQVIVGVVAVISLYLAPLLASSLLVVVWALSIGFIGTTHTYYLRLVDTRAARPGASVPSYSGVKDSSKAI